MTTNVSILTTHDTFTKLHELVEGRRKPVKVSPDDLLHLLMDHSTMIGALQASSSFKVIEPKPHRTRLRASGEP